MKPKFSIPTKAIFPIMVILAFIGAILFCANAITPKPPQICSSPAYQPYLLELPDGTRIEFRNADEEGHSYLLRFERGLYYYSRDDGNYYGRTATFRLGETETFFDRTIIKCEGDQWLIIPTRLMPTPLPPPPTTTPMAIYFPDDGQP
jgi:hypothetical protein